MPRTSKFFRAVAGFLTVMAFAVLAGTQGAAAQQQRVRPGRTQLTAGELFAEIEKQSGLLFAINHGNFDTSRMIEVPAEADVAELVRLALTDTPLTYRISGRHILIVSHRGEQEMKRSQAEAAASDFRGLGNRTYDNPAFEADLAAYNASVSGRYAPAATEEQTAADSVRIIYVPRADSVFTYPDAEFALKHTRIPALVPAAAGYPADAPARLSLKVNMAYAAALTPNLALEIGLGQRTSLDLTASYNPWRRKGTREDNAKLVHWTARPEFRYWLCERSNGHFFGANLFFWRYNIGGHDLPPLFERGYRYDGHAVGAGITYGYHLPLAKRWGMEFSAGAGAAWLKYDRYSCVRCNRDLQKGEKFYFGPTELGIKLVFIIK